MKNLIRICTFLTLIAVFSVVSAKAQSVQRLEAEIPFSFSVGANTYEAGTYVIKLSRATVGNLVTLEDDKNNLLKMVFAAERGDSASKRHFLKFVRSEDNSMALSKIVTSGRNLTLSGVPKTKAKAGAFAGESQTVSINLK